MRHPRHIADFEYKTDNINMRQWGLAALIILSLSGCKRLSIRSVNLAIQDIISPCNSTELPFGGGSGSGADPYQICSVAQLEQISNFNTSHFILKEDLDFTPHYNAGLFYTESPSNFGTPLQISSLSSGSFDGNQHTLSHYTSGNGGGLFEFVLNSTVHDLILENFTVHSDGGSVGGFIDYFTGNASDITIKNSTITAITHGTVGGIFGSVDRIGIGNPSTVTELHSENVVVETDMDTAGGVIGEISFSTLSNATMTGTGHVSGLGSAANIAIAGGVLGTLTISELTDSSSTVEVKGSSYVGGLVGYARTTFGTSGKIENCSATGNISYTKTLATHKNIGGLVGTLETANGDFSIISSSATGNINTTVAVPIAGDYADHVGGLIGCSDYKGLVVDDSSASGTVRGNEGVGGLIGYLYYCSGAPSNNPTKAIINNGSIATGDVSGYGAVGGLIGYAHSTTIDNAHREGASTVRGSIQTGGLVGATQNTNILNSHSYSPITCFLEACGGLVGEFKSMIVDNTVTLDYYITNTIPIPYLPSAIQTKYFTADNGTLLMLYSDNSIDASEARGEVTYLDGAIRVGGLVGYSEGAFIQNSNSQGDVVPTVTGAGSSDTGGLIGFALSSQISNSHSVSDVTGDVNVGGLVGRTDTTNPSSGLYTASILSKLDGTTGARNYSTGSVTGVTNVAGLVGKVTDTEIHFSYASGAVVGNQNVGGAIGVLIQSTYDIPISQTYASSEVTSTLNGGGFIGNFYQGKIEESYASGNLSVGDTNVGGFAGKVGDGGATDWAILTNCFASGNPHGVTNVGGLVGIDMGGDTLIELSFTKATSVVATSGMGENATVGEGFGTTYSDLYFYTNAGAVSDTNPGTIGKANLEDIGIPDFSGVIWTWPGVGFAPILSWMP